MSNRSRSFFANADEGWLSKYTLKQLGIFPISLKAEVFSRPFQVSYGRVRESRKANRVKGSSEVVEIIGITAILPSLRSVPAIRLDVGVEVVRGLMAVALRMIEGFNCGRRHLTVTKELKEISRKVAGKILFVRKQATPKHAELFPVITPPNSTEWMFTLPVKDWDSLNKVLLIADQVVSGLLTIRGEQLDEFVYEELRTQVRALVNALQLIEEAHVPASVVRDAQDTTDGTVDSTGMTAEQRVVFDRAQATRQALISKAAQQTPPWTAHLQRATGMRLKT